MPVRMSSMIVDTQYPSLWLHAEQRAIIGGRRHMRAAHA